MEESILISNLNDFVFCPASIYFHNLYGKLDGFVYQTTDQIRGKNSHHAIDNATYSTKKNTLQGISVYSEAYNFRGKIDIFDVDKSLLTERKRKITTIYDGYIFQVYAQYYALTEMGYNVTKIKLYSSSDNKGYNILLPSENPEMDNKFKATIKAMHEFDIENFVQTNHKKCEKCIYDPICDKSLKC